MAHTLEFASACRSGEFPIDCIEIWKTSTMEPIRTEPEEGFASNWRFITCENHWTIVFKYGGRQAIATKYRGYDLKWRHDDLAEPSVVLKFEPRPSCPSMSDVAWKICAVENPNTKAFDCSQFVYNFVMTCVNERHIHGPVDELIEHLRASR